MSVSAYDRDEPWRLVPSRTQLLSGAVTVAFDNSHAQATRSLALSAGTWTLWCGIGDPKERGMVASVTVTDG